MSFADKTLTCRDCSTAFTFTAGEQEFFAQKGFENQPTRCTNCRQARKQSRSSGGYDDYGSSGGSSSYSGGGSSYGGGSSSYGGGSSSYGGGREQREMHTATCAACGKDAQVPFVPRGDKPVYCADCFQSQRTTQRSNTRW